MVRRDHRGRLRKLKREAEGKGFAIPQPDGSVAKFPQSAGIEAFMNQMDRLGAGPDAPPLHPLIKAATRSPDPRWNRSFFAKFGIQDDWTDWTDPIPDLSEQAHEPGAP